MTDRPTQLTLASRVKTSSRIRGLGAYSFSWREELGSLSGRKKQPLSGSTTHDRRRTYRQDGTTVGQ